MTLIHLHYDTCVSASFSDVWKWITSVHGIAAEMWPYFKMTAPRNVKGIDQVNLVLGQRLFRSHIFLFGFLPFGHDDMTLVEFEEGKGFTEDSPMTAMKSWRHQRHVSEEADGIHIIDDLTFEPAHAARMIGTFMKRVFDHRHEVIKRNLDKS